MVRTITISALILTQTVWPAAEEGDAVMLTLLRTTSATATQYPSILGENARIAYKNEEWSFFFGLSLFSRKYFLNAPETGRTRLLEVLAMMRHCQWKQARALTKSLGDLYSSQWKSAVVFLSQGLQVAPLLPSDHRVSVPPTKRKTILPYFSLWSIGSIDPRQLYVDRLRRTVEPVCKEAHDVAR